MKYINNIDKDVFNKMCLEQRIGLVREMLFDVNIIINSIQAKQIKDVTLIEALAKKTEIVLILKQLLIHKHFFSTCN